MKWIFILFMYVLFCDITLRQDQLNYIQYNLMVTIRKQGNYLFTCDLILTPPSMVFLVFAHNSRMALSVNETLNVLRREEDDIQLG